MRLLQTRQNRTDRRASLTLVEVVASLALLGGTIVALLTAQSRSMQQLAASERQRQAAALAEELIARWQLEDQHLVTNAEGFFEESPAWSWRRTVEPHLVEGKADLLRVQLDITRIDEVGSRHTVSAFVWLEKPVAADP